MRREIDVGEASETDGRNREDHPERVVKLEFTREIKNYNTRFLDRNCSMASVSAVVDGGYRMVFGLTLSYVEHVVTGRKISTCRKNGVFVMQSVMRPNTQPSRTATIQGSDDSEFLR